jgi:hypothetical protein
MSRKDGRYPETLRFLAILETLWLECETLEQISIATGKSEAFINSVVSRERRKAFAEGRETPFVDRRFLKKKEPRP